MRKLSLLIAAFIIVLFFAVLLNGFYYYARGACTPAEGTLTSSIFDTGTTSTLNYIMFAGYVSSSQHIQTKAQNSGGGTNALTFSFPNTKGNLIVAEVDFDSGSGFSSISDSNGNTYFQIGDQQNANGVGFNMKSRLYYAKNINGGSNTVTTQVSGFPSYHELFISEYSGVDANNPLGNYSVHIGSGGSFTSNSITTDNELLYGMELDKGTGTADPGWTIRSSFNNNVVADKISLSAGTDQFTGSSTGGAHIAWIASFKKANIFSGSQGFTPPNAVGAQIAVSNISSGPWSFLGPDGTGNSYYSPSGFGAPLSLNPNFTKDNRYFRYKVRLQSDSCQTNPPEVHNVIIGWSP